MARARAPLHTMAEATALARAEAIPSDGIRIYGRKYMDGHGWLFRHVHRAEDCRGRACVIHNPSDHSMRDFPTYLRISGPYDIKPVHMERICPHGIGHPDPDDAAYHRSQGQSVDVHGCDGCCAHVHGCDGCCASPADDKFLAQ